MAASGRLIDYLGEGLAAARPASLVLASGAVGLYWATDTAALSAWDGSTWTAVAGGGGGGGTVTSVDMSVPADFAIGGNPVTTSGTLALSETTQTANLVKAGPASGSAAVPTYRSLVESDITLSDVTTNDVSITEHGFAPKAPNDATKYLDGTGAYTVPTGAGSVTSVSVTTANGVSGTVATATTTPAISLALGAITPSSVAATGTVGGSNLSGTNTGDQTITLTGDVTGSGTGSFAATIGTGAVTLAKQANFASVSLMGNPTGSSAAPSAITLGSGLSFSGSTLVASGGAGTVTSVSVVTANGFAGTVATATTTPAITVTTSVTGVLQGNGTAISAATSGTDYSAGTSALSTGIIKSTTTTGALTIAVAADFPTLNQNTTGSAAKLTTARTINGTSFDGSANIVAPDSPVNALSIASGVVNIDCSLGDYFTLALTANVTSITFSSLPASGYGTSIFVRMKQDATGSRTVALPAAFKVVGASDIAVQSAANAYTALAITTWDQGARWEYNMALAAA